MNEGYRWEKKLFSEPGRAQLEKLALAPWGQIGRLLTKPKILSVDTSLDIFSHFRLVWQQAVDVEFRACRHVDLAIGHGGYGEFDGVATAIARALRAVPQLRTHVCCVIGMQDRGAATR